MALQQAFIYPLAGFCATILLILATRRPAEWLGLVDLPGGRKAHEGAVPLCGGPAMILAFCLLVYGFDLLPSARYGGLIGGAMLLALIAVLDGIRGVSMRLRIAAQILAAAGCMVVWGQLQLVNVGDLLTLGEIPLGYGAMPFTIFCVVGVVNAINFSDGVDGLCGGLAVIALSSFAAIALAAGQTPLFELLLAVVGTVLGFLLFNLRAPWRGRASVFMGDAGSTFLGFVLAWTAIELTQGAGNGGAISPITAVWILGLPIVDAINAILSRILRGCSPFTPGHDHLHHILLLRGYSSGRTVQILLGASATMSAVGLAGHYIGLSECAMFAAFLALSAAYFLVLRHFGRLRHVLTIQRRRVVGNSGRHGTIDEASS